MSDQPQHGGPAFPVPMFTRQADGQPMSAGEFFEGGDGMNLRDWFAGMAIGSCFAAPCPPAWAQGSHEHREQSVAAAYLIADAMLAARKKGGEA